MNRFKRLSGVISAVAAAAVVLTNLCFVPNAVSADEKVDLGTFTAPTKDSLGSVLDYMVFAETIQFGNHSEGVYAAKYLEGGAADGSGITENVVDYTDPNERYIYIENFRNWTAVNFKNGVNADYIIVPDAITIDRTYNNGNGFALYDGTTCMVAYNNITDVANKGIIHVSESTYQIDFTSALSGMAQYAAARAAENTASSGTTITKSDTSTTDWNNWKIDITCSSGKNVINLTAYELANFDLNITGPSDGAYSIIINVTDLTETSYTFDREIKIDGSDSLYGAQGGRLLYNFNTYSGTVTFNKNDQGCVLAPSATVVVTSSHNGSIFAKKAYNPGCEFHQNRFIEYGTTTTTTPTPDGGETTPTPDGGETTPTPDGGETTPTPDGGETTPTPDGGETTPTPDGGETTPTPDGGETTPTPDGGETTPTPDGGETTTTTPTDVDSTDRETTTTDTSTTDVDSTNRTTTDVDSTNRTSTDVDSANRNRSTEVDSADRTVVDTGENDVVNVVSALILATSAALVVIAVRLRREEEHQS